MSLASCFAASDVTRTPAAKARPKKTKARTTPAGLPGEFEAFAAEVRRGLDPQNRLEVVLTDRVILAAWRLHLLSLDEASAARSCKKLPLMTQEVLRAESSLETAMTVLRAARADDGPRWGHAAPTDSKAGQTFDEVVPPSAEDDLPDLSNEWPVLPAEVDGYDEDDDADVHTLWRDRLTFDPTVSETSPVVKGTWVTAGHVVSLIVDGWTWSDVLRTHPELTEGDVRACLAYTAAQDGLDEV